LLYGNALFCAIVGFCLVLIDRVDNVEDAPDVVTLAVGL